MEARDVDLTNTIDGDMTDEFVRFYREQYPIAVRLAWLLTHDHQASEDVAQDAFVRLRQRFAAIEHRAAYLRTCVLNGCRDRARAAERSAARLRRAGATVGEWANDRPSELLDAVARLPYKQRVVLVLRYWADLPEHEIAAAVGVRSGTVRTLVARALAALRKEMPE